MIHQIGSKEVMDLLHQSKNTLDNMSSTIQHAERIIAEKNRIQYNETEYLSQQLNSLKLIGKQSNRLVIADNTIIDGVYDQYGHCVYPKFLSKPINLFNIEATAETFFRGGAICYLSDPNNVDSSVCPYIDKNSFLYHESIKEKDAMPFFYEFIGDKNNRIVKLQIIIDEGVVLGANGVNLIELSPHLIGSFNINEINIYSVESYLSNISAPDITLNNISSVGNARIQLPKRINMKKIEFVFNLTHKNSAKLFPFGLRHLYFYDALYMPNSYVVCKYTHDEYIKTIDNRIIVHGVDYQEETTMSREKIEVYSDRELLDKVQVSTASDVHIIPKNTKELYLKIPVNKSISMIDLTIC